MNIDNIFKPMHTNQALFAAIQHSKATYNSDKTEANMEALKAAINAYNAVNTYINYALYTDDHGYIRIKDFNPVNRKYAKTLRVF